MASLDAARDERASSPASWQLDRLERWLRVAEACWLPRWLVPTLGADDAGPRVLAAGGALVAGRGPLFAPGVADAAVARVLRSLPADAPGPTAGARSRPVATRPVVDELALALLAAMTNGGDAPPATRPARGADVKSGALVRPLRVWLAAATLGAPLEEADMATALGAIASPPGEAWLFRRVAAGDAGRVARAVWSARERAAFSDLDRADALVRRALGRLDAAGPRRWTGVRVWIAPDGWVVEGPRHVAVFDRPDPAHAPAVAWLMAVGDVLRGGSP